MLTAHLQLFIISSNRNNQPTSSKPQMRACYCYLIFFVPDMFRDERRPHPGIKDLTIPSSANTLTLSLTCPPLAYHPQKKLASKLLPLIHQRSHTTPPRKKNRPIKAIRENRPGRAISRPEVAAAASSHGLLLIRAAPGSPGGPAAARASLTNELAPPRRRGI